MDEECIDRDNGLRSVCDRKIIVGRMNDTVGWCCRWCGWGDVDNRLCSLLWGWHIDELVETVLNRVDKVGVGDA